MLHKLMHNAAWIRSCLTVSRDYCIKGMYVVRGMFSMQFEDTYRPVCLYPGCLLVLYLDMI